MAEFWTRRVCGWIGWVLLAAWLLWLVGLLGSEDGMPAWLDDHFGWAALVAVVLLLCSRYGGRVLERLHHEGRPATATVIKVRFRGRWGHGEGEPEADWFDLWLDVLSAGSEGRGRFEAFSCVGVYGSPRRNFVVGETISVIFDPVTGVTVPARNGHPIDFAPGRTLRRLGRIRRRNARAAARAAS